MGSTKIDEYNLQVYGEFDFAPVIVDLLNSDAVQRLHHIQQHGPDIWVWDHANITRFEHSLGVLLFLCKLGVGLENQIAGLIHDVSHTAFSHAIDFVFGRELQGDFGDRAFKKIVLSSDIPTILQKHGFCLEHLIDLDNFPVVKKLYLTCVLIGLIIFVEICTDTA